MAGTEAMKASAVTLGLGVIHERPVTGASTFWKLIKAWTTAALSLSVRRYGGVETMVLSWRVIVKRPREVDPVPRYWVTVMEVLRVPSTRDCQWKWRLTPSAPLITSQNCVSVSF